MGQESVILETYSITNPTWFPLEEAVAGTISSQGVLITSIGGDFRTDYIAKGDWLVNKNGNEARQITDVYSASQLEVSSAFTGDPLAGATVVIVREKAMRYLKVDFISNAGTMKAATQAIGGAWAADLPWESQSFNAFVTPQLVTPGAGGANVIMGI